MEEVFSRFDPYQAAALTKYTKLKNCNPNMIIAGNEVENTISRICHGHTAAVLPWVSGDKKVSDFVEIIKGL